MFELVWDVIKDTLIDGLKLLPFLFLTYLVMEYIEHKTNAKARGFIKRSGRFGPLVGSLLGAFPQCGFSAAASNLYAGRIITLGTLIAIYLSTSDEMLPIFISEQVSLVVILKLLGIKIVIGMAAGFLIDFFTRKLPKMREEDELRIGHMCEHEHCNCQKENIWKSAVKHTLHILLFILLVSFVLNGVIAFVGEDALASLILNKPVIGPLIAGLIGLIPNCAASVVITELYLEGILGVGSMISGLLVGAGVGLLVLFKVNDNLKENIKITVLLYAIGAATGIIMEMTGLVI